MSEQSTRGALSLDEGLAEMKRSVEHARKLYFESREESERLRTALQRIYQTYCTAADPTDEMGRIAHETLAVSEEANDA